MSKQLDVLISGASIAGLSTAYWLAQFRHRVTLVEQAYAPRSGGVAIDIRMQALDVASEMGILDEVKMRRVAAADIYEFVNAVSEVEATFDPAKQFYDSPNDVEILRDTLVDILMKSVPDHVEKLFGIGIEKLKNQESGVDVVFDDRTERHFDLVIGADGMHSNVRRLAFGPEPEMLRHLGLYVAIVKNCEVDEPVVGSIVYNLPGRMAMLRGDGTSCSLLLGFRSPLLSYNYRDAVQQRNLVLEAFRDMHGWRMAEVHRELERAQDIYFDAVGQIVMPKWTKGRVALVGDSGYCASFFSGMGSSLAMIGARTLAQSIESNRGNLRLGLAAYDRTMAPIVAEAQEMAEGGAEILFPSTENEIEERNQRIKLLSEQS